MWLRHSQELCRRKSNHPFFPDGLYSDSQFNGPLSHWQEFRTALTQIHRDGFDWERFVGDTGIRELREATVSQISKLAGPLVAGMESFGEGTANAEFPFFSLSARIASWTEKSRRCFRIGEEMQLLLAATPLDGIPWEAVRFPFDSFMIKLALPIPYGKRNVTAILVSRESEYRPEEYKALTNIDLPVTVTMITDNMGEHPISMQFKMKITKKLRTNPNGALMDLSHLWAESLDVEEAMAGGLPIPTDYFHMDVIQTGEAKDFDKIHGHAGNMVYRILFGMMLYLNTRQGGSDCKYWVDSEEKIPGMHRIITDGSQICDLGHRYTLTDDERRAFQTCMEGHGGWEVDAHARCGHFRRPPYSFLDAEKTIWVRPCIVREDRLVGADGPPGVIMGSEQILASTWKK